MAVVAVLGGACAGAAPSDGVGADHGELMIVGTPEDAPDEGRDVLETAQLDAGSSRDAGP